MILYNNCYNRRKGLEEFLIVDDYTQLFPDISRKRVLNIMSELKGAIDSYLIHDALTYDSLHQRSLLHRAYQQRGLYKQANKLLNQSKKEISSIDATDIWSILEHQKIFHQSFFSDNPIKYVEREGLLAFSRDLLSQFNSRLSNLYKFTYIHFGAMIRSYKLPATQKETPEHKGVVFQQLERLLLNQSEDSFFFLLDFIKNWGREKSPISEVASLVVACLINFALKKYKQGNTAYLDYLLKIYEIGLNKKMFLSHGKLSHIRFLNFIEVALGSHQFHWAKEFIELNSELLDSQIRADTIEMAKALINFEKGNYGQVIVLIRDLSFSDFSLTLRQRWLLLISYYEQFKDNFEFMKSLIKNYRAFILNNKKKISEHNFLGSLNLARAVMKLVKNESISKNLNSGESLVHRKWLNLQETNRKRS